MNEAAIQIAAIKKMRYKGVTQQCFTENRSWYRKNYKNLLNI
jgi:hypothetical protein